MTIFYRLTAVFCLLAGGALAWQHPLWPLLALAGFYICCVVAAWQPGIWLFVVPATLPLLNFSPWTGWLIFDEFDLLLLGTLTGAFARLAWQLRAAGKSWEASSTKLQNGPVDATAARSSSRIMALLALMAGFAVIALLRGFAAAGGFAFPSTPGFGHYLEQAYVDPMNSVRVFKSLGFALLFLPLLRHEMQTPAQQARACRLLGAGMVAGLSLVALVVVWERAAFPGLLNFSTHYRTTALFWEMHVGGAAIDAYLAMAAPFVVWALGRSGRLSRWLPLALLAVLVCYAGLTTFSRGVYLALALPLVLLAGGAWARKSGFNWRELLLASWQRLRHGGWRTRAGLLLGAVLLLEVAGVVGGGTFMRERLANTENDLASRIAHWQRGLSLLQTPADWVFGRGLGRLPAEYAAIGPETEFPGAVHLATDDTDDSKTNRFISISGPQTNEDLGGFYALTQRVDVIAPGNYRVQMRVRVSQNTDMILKICEKHLLYEGLCQARWIRLRPAAQGWQPIAVPLTGDELSGATELIPRFGVFSIFVVNAGGQADIRGVKLIGPNHKDLLANGDFSHGLAQWFPSAGGYYLPWHIDNLYLEVLIERGVAGLVLSGCLMIAALSHLIFGVGPRRPMAAYLAASIGGALLIGLMSSVMDVPRVAFLLYLLAFFSVHLTQEPN